MEIQISYKNKDYTSNLNEPIDISIPVGNVKCFFAPDAKMTPFESGDFVGAVKAGAPVNFFDVVFNPHGNGTHTECLGHITKQQQSVNQELQKFHFISQLVTVKFETKKNNDQIIALKNLREELPKDLPEALIIRTSPNRNSKLTKDYSGTNPPYLEAKAMEFLVKKGVKHLLIDLPSVDRELDDGVLEAHHIFWNIKGRPRKDCTITELIFVPNTVEDGLYLLNIQIAPLELDASPSKPVIYKLS